MITYLFLPPGYTGNVPEGYFVVKSPTYSVTYGVRGFLVDGKPDQAVALMKQIKVYPLAQVANLPKMEFLNGSGQPIDTVHSDNFSFFVALAQLVNEEPADVFTPLERFYMRSIGIEHGKPFNPDAKDKALLSLLGVPKETVCADYLRTNDYLLPYYQKAIDGFVAGGGDRAIPVAIFGVKRDYLEAAFDEMQKRYGSIEDYFAEGLGIDAAGQQGHGLAALQIDQHGAIPLVFLQGKIVHPQDGGRGASRDGQPAEQAQQRVPTHGQVPR